MSTIELIKSSNNFKIDIFNNYYKPHKLTVFHETYYFNILPISRLNETIPNSLTSGLKAIILDPFKRNLKRNELNQSQQCLPSQNQQLYQNNSSDSDTDDYMVIQEQNTSPKLFSLAQEKEAKTKSNVGQVDKLKGATNLFSDIKVYTSENSLSLYKNYVNETNFIENKFSNLFKINDDTKSIEIIEPRVSAESESIYKSSVNVAVYGAYEPDKHTLSVYEEYIKNLSKTNETI